jgi:hypothetical protein
MPTINPDRDAGLQRKFDDLERVHNDQKKAVTHFSVDSFFGSPFVV